MKTYTFNVDTGVCECADSKSYIDKTTGQCIPCIGFGNATGDLNQTTNLCICQATFVFTPSISKKGCICPTNFFYLSTTDPLVNTCINCNVLKGKNGTGFVNKTDGKSC